MNKIVESMDCFVFTVFVGMKLKLESICAYMYARIIVTYPVILRIQEVRFKYDTLCILRVVFTVGF